ncbi:MAG TPA: 7-carboxy-7-deazaguanine synthase QueE [Gemmatales bacterium]|nr:7-carboxy-7-deazaguanine synthase QueE [Gemmatales bacterium]HMP59150.1 7-carboxy-7-deazaguanine synthase QueE [Gemmatales bacterium]
MLIAEIFHSIQGEGGLVGMPSAFVRTSGCNLRCGFCDTPYTSWQPEGTELSVAAILAQLEPMPTRHVVVTGGEPLLAADVGELCAALRAGGWHITIETAATIAKEVVADLMSLSPKLANSTPWERDTRWAALHEQRRLNLDAIRFLMGLADYQFKFVIDQPGDTAEVLALLEQLPEVDRAKVLLMPQATTPTELAEKSTWLSAECLRLGLRFGPRLHLQLFGHRRGT